MKTQPTGGAPLVMLPRLGLLALGTVQFAIGAVVTEDDNPQAPPLFPVYFGCSLFLEALP